MSTTKRVYWIDESRSSRQNGIGTYRDILLPQLGKKQNIKVALISLNSDGADLEVTEREFGLEYSIPTIAGGNWQENGALIWSVLKQYITDSDENLFMMNHSPCAGFIKVLKEIFPKSRISFTIHDQGWCTTLLGDGNLLSEIIVNNQCPERISQKTADYVHQQVNTDLELYNMVDKIFCLSASTKKILIDIYGISEHKISMIPNGYRAEKCTAELSKYEVRQSLGLLPDDEVLIFVGRPAYYKGIVPLLTALKQLRQNHSRLRCVFTGGIGNFSKFEEYTSAVATNIVCIGHVPHSELNKWYAAADVGIMASYSEQCSYAALEMMANGLPIVASDGNGVRDIFSENNAIIAPIESVLKMEPYAMNLAIAIDKALSLTPDEKIRLAVANHQLLAAKFSPTVMASKYAEVILQTVECA